MKAVKFTFFFLLAFSSAALAGPEAAKPMHLTLKQAMVLASRENAQVFAANERVRQALADISASRGALLPQLTGVFGGRRQTTDLRASGINIPGDPHVGPFNSFDTRGRLTMEILDPAAIKRLDSAKAGERLSRAESLKVRQDILAMAGALFLEAQRSAQSVGLNRVQLKEAQRQYRISSMRLKQGTGSEAGLKKAQAGLAEAQYVLKAAQVRAEQTRLDLASALRLPLDQPIILDEERDWMDQDLKKPATNPDLVVAQATLDKARANLSLARADLLPKITAFGDYGRLGGSPSQASNTYALGIQVSVPVWEGGSKQAQLKAARSKVEEEKVLLADAQSQDQVRLREAKNNLDQAKTYLRAKMEQLDYAEHQKKTTATRLNSGSGSRLEMEQTQSMQAIALDEKNEAQAAYLTARINLARAYGNIEELFEIKGDPSLR